MPGNAARHEGSRRVTSWLAQLQNEACQARPSSTPNCDDLHAPGAKPTGTGLRPRYRSCRAAASEQSTPNPKAGRAARVQEIGGWLRAGPTGRAITATDHGPRIQTTDAERITPRGVCLAARAAQGLGWLVIGGASSEEALLLVGWFHADRSETPCNHPFYLSAAAPEHRRNKKAHARRRQRSPGRRTREKKKQTVGSGTVFSAPRDRWRRPLSADAS